MEDTNSEKFLTEIHPKEVAIEIQTIENEQNIETSFDTFRYVIAQYRLVRRKFKSFIREHSKENSKQVLFVTQEHAPVDYIHAFQKQYPNIIVKTLRPVINRPTNAEKTKIVFEFYSQNRVCQAILYKYKRTRENIEEYGLYVSAFNQLKEFSDINKIEFLAPFTKALRICAKKLNPSIIHSDNIPFFLGAEFEKKSNYPIKVLQVVNDFSNYEFKKCETFWAAINLVDSRGMKKICRDRIIKKCIATLFNLHNTKRFYQMRDCLGFIYKNYSKFRQYVDKCEDIEENILFNRLNARIIDLFPQMVNNNDSLYNLISFSITKSHHWATKSKTYYEELFKNPYLSGKLFPELEKQQAKSSALLYGCDIKLDSIYQEFSSENFRELREYNKKCLIREFSKERVATKFSDISLFKEEDYKIYGYLDSFYQAPLIFCSLTKDIYQQGVDIAMNSIFKIFEKYKNIQLIINIPNGMENDYIKSWVNFVSNNNDYKGRWIFIDSEINLPKFLAGSDMILLPKRENPTTKEHFFAMHYGCIPIAARTGVYNDTIADIFDDIINGCGFKTKVPLITEDDPTEIYSTILQKALNLYSQNPASWNLLIKNAINYNSGWKFDIIEDYYNLYQQFLFK